MNIAVVLLKTFFGYLTYNYAVLLAIYHVYIMKYLIRGCITPYVFDNVVYAPAVPISLKSDFA